MTPDRRNFTLVAFDGLDGSGKTTQIELLAAAASNAGRRVDVRRLGRAPRFREVIEELNTERGRVPPKIRELVYYFEALHTSIGISKSNEDAMVVMDRYFLSCMAYGPLNGCDKVDVEWFNRYLLRPDYSFFIDVHPDECLRRINRYRRLNLPEIGFREAGSASASEATFLEFQRSVRDNFLSSLRPEHIVIDGNQRPDEVHRAILEHLGLQRTRDGDLLNGDAGLPE